jgi:hypothetical protein
MGQWGGFLDAPAEFFAGTSGQWFTDSWLTVRLGIARFDGGRPWPIDQAYLFVDAYSNGDPYTRFFHTDTQGNVTMERAPLARDGQGRITDLWYRGSHVRFDLAEDGHVTAVSLGPVDVPPAAAGAAPRLIVFPNPVSGSARVRLEGMSHGATATLHDLSGRRVTRLPAVAEGAWRLERTDERGRHVPPGVFLIRVRGGGRTLACRVVLLD